MHITLGSSKALLMFEDDPRFVAVEKDREREELFEDYMVDLERKVCALNLSRKDSASLNPKKVAQTGVSLFC